ncbi:MAG: PilZ domain-containing protein [Terriglobia bacterium]
MWGLFGKKKSSTVDRAPRLAVNSPVHFRKAGDFGWTVGKMQNISRSGMLFAAGTNIPLNVPVEIQFTAPPVVGLKGGELLIARGKVVRTIMPPASDQPPAFAAKFKSIETVRQRGDW